MHETIVTHLQQGETVKFRPHGNSMTPRIKSGQLVTVAPVDPAKLRVGDIALARVAGVLRLHKVSAIDPVRKRVQISNNHGHVNGYTGYTKVYGQCIAVELRRSEGPSGPALAFSPMAWETLLSRIRHNEI